MQYLVSLTSWCRRPRAGGLCNETSDPSTNSSLPTNSPNTITSTTTSSAKTDSNVKKPTTTTTTQQPAAAASLESQYNSTSFLNRLSQLNGVAATKPPAPPPPPIAQQQNKQQQPSPPLPSFPCCALLPKWSISSSSSSSSALNACIHSDVLILILSFFDPIQNIHIRMAPSPNVPQSVLIEQQQQKQHQQVIVVFPVLWTASSWFRLSHTHYAVTFWPKLYRSMGIKEQVEYLTSKEMALEQEKVLKIKEQLGVVKVSPEISRLESEIAVYDKQLRHLMMFQEVCRRIQVVQLK